jgi:hypothetical protein
MTDDDVVAAFNELGYTASFGAVQRHLANGGIVVTLDALYLAYPSREALAEQWLSGIVPPAANSLRDAFIGIVAVLLDTLESRRDFSRAWLSSMVRTGPLHLPQLQNLHDYVQRYFVTWLEAHEAILSIPANVPLLQAKEDIADALSALVAWLVVHWQSDRSTGYGNTRAMADSVACLVDGLLMARGEFGGAGLLFHLHRLFDVQHRRFLLPLLETFLSSERASRLIDPVSLLEFIRTLTPSPVQRP